MDIKIGGAALLLALSTVPMQAAGEESFSVEYNRFVRSLDSQGENVSIKYAIGNIVMEALKPGNSAEQQMGRAFLDAAAQTLSGRPPMRPPPPEECSSAEIYICGGRNLEWDARHR